MIHFVLPSPSKSAILASRKAHPAAAADLSSAVHLFLSPSGEREREGGGEGKHPRLAQKLVALSLRESARNNEGPALSGGSGRRRAPCTKSWRSAAFPA